VKLLALSLVTLGAALTTTGAFLIYPPAGFITGGVWLVAAGAFGFDVEG
jgi:hypothetical protein